MSTADLGQYVAAVRQNGVILNSNEPLTVAGATTLSGTTTVSGAATFTSAVAFKGSISGQLSPVVDVTATTLAPTAAQSGTTFMLDSAGSTNALVVTLPTPVVGLKYTFVVTTAATGSYTYKIYTGSASVFYVGTDAKALVGTAEGDSEWFQSSGTTNTYFDMNGTTTGGLIGSTIEVQCLSSTLWKLNAVQFGSGTLATSFGTS